MHWLPIGNKTSSKFFYCADVPQMAVLLGSSLPYYQPINCLHSNMDVRKIHTFMLQTTFVEGGGETMPFCLSHHTCEKNLSFKNQGSTFG